MNFTDKQIQWLQWIALVLVIGIFGFLNHPAPVPVPPTPAEPQRFGASTILWTATSSTLEALSGATFKMDSGSTETNAAAVTFSGTVTTTGTTVQSGPQIYTPAATISVTNASTITPTNAIYQPLTSSGAVTVSVVATNTATIGQYILLKNANASGTIVITNGAAAGTSLPSGANYSLTVRSILELIFDGTNWVAVGASSN